MKKDIKEALFLLVRAGLSEDAIDNIIDIIRQAGKEQRLALDLIYAEGIHG